MAEGVGGGRGAEDRVGGLGARVGGWRTLRVWVGACVLTRVRVLRVLGVVRGGRLVCWLRDFWVEGVGAGAVGRFVCVWMCVRS